MSKFIMQRAYSDKQTIETDDLVTAIKYASNYEADLFLNGKLILSPLGWEHEYQAEVLTKYGVTQYYKNNSLTWKYTDESKNVNKLFVEYYEYTWDGEPQVQITVREYRARKADLEFTTIDEVKDYCEKRWCSSVSKFDTSYFIDNEHWTDRYTLVDGWLKDRMYYIVGIFDSFVPAWLCIHAENEKQAIEKYIKIQKGKLFEDEYSRIRVHGTSRNFIHGSLEEYYAKGLCK